MKELLIFLKSVYKGKIINVKSEVGDVIVWKLTTTYSPNADIISLLPNYTFHPRLTKLLPNFLKKKSIDPRLALFMGFGVEDHYTEDYIEYLKTSQLCHNPMEEFKLQ